MTTAEAKSKERTTVYLSPQTKQGMERAAEEAGQTKSIWVERLIANHLQAKVGEING
jgi:hypothetical protein